MSKRFSFFKKKKKRSLAFDDLLQTIKKMNISFIRKRFSVSAGVILEQRQQDVGSVLGLGFRETGL